MIRRESVEQFVVRLRNSFRRGGPAGSGRLWLKAAVGTACSAAVLGLLPEARQSLDASEEGGSFRQAYANAAVAEPAGGDAAVLRMNYFDAAWSRVLSDLAEAGGKTLVMAEAPAGRFSWRDRRKYSFEEAMRLVNAELEPLGYRLLPQREYLVVLQLDDARTRYARPRLSSSDPADSRPAAGTSVRPAGWQQSADRPPVQSPAPSTDDRSSAPPAAFQAEPVRPQPPAAQATVLRRVACENTKAADLARTLYLVFESRAELVREGVLNLPTFDVYETDEAAASGSQSPLFRLGIDQYNNELVVEAAEARAESLQRVIADLDKPQDGTPGADVRLRPNKGLEAGTAKDLNKQIHQLVTARQDALDEQGVLPGAARNPAELAGMLNGGQPPQAGQGSPLRIQGEVTVQALQDLGILILRGNEADLDRVELIINDLEQMSVGTMPDIHILSLEYANSEAMSELLASVYEELAELRGNRGGNDDNTASFIPVVQPNAILILAPEVEMEAIIELARQLDSPIGKESEFEVFELRSAIASQVVTALETFYEDRGGLGTRVRAIADVRTNTVVVQGNKRDLEEVSKLIERIDRDEPGSVHRVQIFQLNNATAEELNEVINSAIQAVINPPNQTGAGGLGGFGGGFGGTQGAQELRDNKSVALEFLTTDGDVRRLVRSGILADVRVNSDVRTNTLIVSAPEASMSLMAALIRELDRSPAAIAEIKVFTLQNADASQSVELLTTLFENQNQEDQLGVQIAGTEDAVSSLVPVQFSADVRTNTVLAVGSAESLGVVEAILLRLDTQESRQRNTTIIPLRNAPAELVAQSLDTFLQQQQALQDSSEDLISNIERLRQEVIVAPDTNSNSLIISSSPQYFSQITQIIETLDSTPPEVIIQALIVEVQLDQTDEFGVELGFQDPLLLARGLSTTTAAGVTSITGMNFNDTGNPLPDSSFLNRAGTVTSQGLSNFSLGRQNSDLGFGGFVFSAQSDAVNVLIRALAAKRTVHILSRPQVRATHNNPALVRVGQQVPIVNGVTINNNTTTPNVTQENIGIILEVTPRITPDGTIAMSVYAEKSDLAPGGVPIFTDLATGNVVESVIINEAVADTTVNVPNGQTIVIGGMITKNDDTLERKVPWLGDLPLVGKAFRYDSTNVSRTELLIFLTPRIIFSDIDAEVIKQIEAERMHFIETEAEEVHGPLYSVPSPDAGMPPGGYSVPAYGGEGNYVPEYLPESELPPEIPVPETGSRDATQEDDGFQWNDIQPVRGEVRRSVLSVRRAQGERRGL